MSPAKWPLLVFYQSLPSSETFKPPLLDGTLSLPEIYDWHMKNCPRHPLFVFVPSNRSPRTIFWPEAVRAMHTGAKLVRKMMGWEPGLMDPPVVGAAGAILESKAVAMRAMVNKYTQNLPSRPCRPSDGGDEYESSDSEEVVLLTGTTGALGYYVLAELVQNPNVLRVYAVNRVSVNDTSGGLPERQKRALIRRGLDADVILESGKAVLLEADISLPNLGLQVDVYDKVKKSTTRIIHNAWPVDFNLALSSFERSIKGLRNLIDLSLTSPRTSPPTVVYTSSIDVFQNVDSTLQDFPLPESPIAAEVAIGTGYTESKWVSEEILIESTKRTALNTIVVRVGQLTGGLNGCWNTSEWLPSIIQESELTGSWVSSGRRQNMAARVLVDFRKPVTLGTSSLVHLIHPKPVPWSSLAHSVAKSLSLSLVHFSEWVGKLEELHRQRSDSGVGSQLVNLKSRREVAGLRLLPFLRSLETKAHKSLNAFGFVRLCCDNAVLLSPTLASRAKQAPPVDAKDVELWLKYWQSDGFLKTEASQCL
ncbi:hypothetical protein CPC08DRAFT_754299 [Agrocybe pediades]|nr:hypothetical protein CPC08DRAFT_754299 [Agrocybe pediades]